MLTLSPTPPSEEKAKSLLTLATTLGILFQIRDDYQNLASADYADAKGFAEDLSEGKWSFPVLHAVYADAGNPFLVDIVKSRTENVEVKKRAVRYLEGMGSLRYTRETMGELEREVKQRMEELGGNGGLEGILARLKV